MKNSSPLSLFVLLARIQALQTSLHQRLDTRDTMCVRVSLYLDPFIQSAILDINRSGCKWLHMWICHKSHHGVTAAFIEIVKVKETCSVGSLGATCTPFCAVSLSRMAAGLGSILWQARGTERAVTASLFTRKLEVFPVMLWVDWNIQVAKVRTPILWPVSRTENSETTGALVICHPSLAPKPDQVKAA